MCVALIIRTIVLRITFIGEIAQAQTGLLCKSSNQSHLCTCLKARTPLDEVIVTRSNLTESELTDNIIFRSNTSDAAYHGSWSPHLSSFLRFSFWSESNQPPILREGSLKRIHFSGMFEGIVVQLNEVFLKKHNTLLRRNKMDLRSWTEFIIS